MVLRHASVGIGPAGTAHKVAKNRLSAGAIQLVHRAVPRNAAIIGDAVKVASRTAKDASVGCDSICAAGLGAEVMRTVSCLKVPILYTSIPSRLLTVRRRIVPCKMILKSISSPMLDDPEIGILPSC